MTGGVQLDKRMQAVSTRRDELKRKSRAAIASGQGGLRHTDDGFKKKIVEQLNLSKLLEDPKVAEQMIQAGFRGPRPVTTFYFFRFATPIFFLLFSAFYLFFVNDFGLPPITKLPMIMGATVLGFYGPNVYLKNRIDNRRQSIMQGFPDALDLLLICVEAGMSIESAPPRSNWRRNWPCCRPSSAICPTGAWPMTAWPSGRTIRACAPWRPPWCKPNSTARRWPPPCGPWPRKIASCVYQRQKRRRRRFRPS
jgi:hypothetical protein